MSAVEMQSLLARLYVDKYCRELFRRHPNTLLDDYDLTHAERKAIASIQVDKIDIHAMSIEKQRKRRLSKHFPLLFSLSTEPEATCVLHRLFDRFHSLHPAMAEIDDAVEINMFGLFLRQSICGIDSLPGYASELVRYEHARYLAARGEAVPATGRPAGPVSDDDVPALLAGVRIETFDVDVTAVAVALRNGERPEAAPATPRTVVLQNRDGQLHTLAPSGPTAVLLQHINGERTVRELIDVTERTVGHADLQIAIHGLIERLEEKILIHRV